MVFARRIFGGAMFLVMCSAIAAIACRDIERPVEPTGPKVGQVQQLPPVILSLTCTFGTGGTVVACQQATPPVAAGVSASVIYGTGSPGSAQYGIFYAYNLVKDTVAHTWQFTAYVQNLLKQSIGTLNGTTVTGVKVFVTDFHATSGTETVSVANADGTGTFTAPNQPYFNYNQIVASNGYTGNKLWKFNVPNTVTAVSMSILISTDFPAEASTPSVAADTMPASAYSQTNLISNAPQMSGTFMRNVVLVGFKDGTVAADRQLAVAMINGTVIGGSRYFGDDGVYAMRIPDDGTAGPLFAAIQKLATLPQVAVAVPNTVLQNGIDGLKPVDDVNMPHWTYGDTSTDNLWAFERVDAPLAWGCSTGSANVTVGVVDIQFHDVADLRPNVTNVPTYVPAANVGRHGTAVAAIIGARGNNNGGSTGLMWNASLKLYDRDPGAAQTRLGVQSLQWDIAQMAHAAMDGARVINVSGRAIDTPVGNHGDTVAVQQVVRLLAWTIRGLNSHGKQPLIVFSAGNFGQDTYLNGYPAVVDSFPNQIIVVGAITRTNHYATYSDTGGRVSVLAPGDSVMSLDDQGRLNFTFSATSAAAPIVSGLAGLLFSFDPNLNASDVRRLILAGADSSHLSLRGKSVVNAYWSLRLAAQNPTAPLCGNHIFISGQNVAVQRTPTSQENIWTDPTFPNALNVKHGGHRLIFVNDTGTVQIAYDFPTRQWKASTSATDPPPATDGGVFNSTFGMSHDGDSSLVNVSATSQATVPISVHDVHSGQTTLLTTLSTGLVSSFTFSCDRRQRNQPNTPCVDSLWTGEQQSATIRSAYSPAGDVAVIAISPLAVDGSVITGWALCFDSPPSGDPLATDCRFISYVTSTLNSKLYLISAYHSTAPPASFLTITTARVHQLGISEDGREVLLGLGELHGAPNSGSPTYTNCGYSFYTMATHVSSTLIPSEFACNWVGTVMASPSRIAGSRVH